MSRSFLRSLNESALVDVAPVSTYPFCMGVWLKKLGGANAETLMFFGDGAILPDAYTRLQIGKFGSIQAHSAHTGNVVTTPAVYDDGNWHACLLVEKDVGGMRRLELYIDGTLIGTDSSTNTGGLSLFDRVAFGRKMTLAPGDALNGTLAEGFIANIGPTVDQVAAWSRGASARRVFGTALKGYWPLWGLHNPEIDVSSHGNDLTLSGTSKDDHAPVSLYTLKWATSLPATNLATRRVSIDGVVIVVAA